MYSRSVLTVIGVFVLSLLLAAGAATLVALGFITSVVFVPLATALAFATLIAILVVILVAASAEDTAAGGYRKRILCGCSNAYLRTAAISALIALIVALVFSGASGVSAVVAAVLYGLTALFLLFAIFLLAAFIFCVLDSICHRCRCSDDDAE